MFKAQQRVVANQANMTLVDIRTAEIKYFMNFFLTFGEQCAILAGSICGTISQCPTQDNPGKTSYFFIFMYNISSALVLALSCHVLICSTFIGIYGEALAIRGPVGSMVKAINGMVKEQEQVVTAFCFAVFFFVIQEVGIFAVVIDSSCFWPCAIILIIGLFISYRAAVRIYNRFAWNSSNEARWDEQKDERASDLGFPDPMTQISDLQKKIAAEKGGSGEGGGEGALREAPFKKQKSKRSSIFKSKKPKRDDNCEADSGDDEDEDVGEKQEDAAEGDRSGMSGTVQKAALHEASNGYLTIKMKKRLLMDPWERRYVVVRGSQFLYYKDKRSYEDNPNVPMTSRPIDLEGFTLIAGAVEPPYNITLTPLDLEDTRKEWKFRTDTLPEFHRWVMIFSGAVHYNGGTGTGSNDQDELMIITSKTQVDRNEYGEDETRTVVESVAYRGQV